MVDTTAVPPAVVEGGFFAEHAAKAAAFALERELRSAAPKPAPRAPALERFAAVRPIARLGHGGRVVATGEEYIDMSTLSSDAGVAGRLAAVQDEKNGAAIRRGDALAFARVARVRVEEVAE